MPEHSEDNSEDLGEVMNNTAQFIYKQHRLDLTEKSMREIEATIMGFNRAEVKIVKVFKVNTIVVSLDS